MEMPNTYLFTAYYDTGDGNVASYEQGTDDRSMLAPADSKRNSFYDIWYAEKPYLPKEQLYAFRLSAIDGAETDPDSPRVVGVNLRNGMFEADGVMFAQHSDQMDEYDRLEDIRLIYFRVPAPEIEAVYDKKTGKILSSKETGNYTLGYVLGWQATAIKAGREPRNIKKFISIGGVPVKGGG